MKFFPLIVHGILAFTVIGASIGVSKVAGVNPVAAGALGGLAFGLVVTGVIRLFFGE